MKSTIKSVAAIAALSFGLGTATTVQAAPDETDQFYQDFYMYFNMQACTNDDYTVAGELIIHPSFTDVQRLFAENKNINPEQLQPYVDAAWKKTVESFTSEAFNPENPPSQQLQDAFINNFAAMTENIEEDTGLSVIIGGAGAAIPTPGCQ